MSTSSERAQATIPGAPPVVDRATWQAARDELLVREKAHTHEGDAIAAARRRLPMIEIDGTTPVDGPNGTAPFIDLFEGRNELVVYLHMWYDGAPPQGQCEGCTTTAWHVHDPAYLHARGVSYAVLTSGAWDEVAEFVDFMGYTVPWYSVGDRVEAIGDHLGQLVSYLRDGDRVFLTYSTTGRGNERVNASMGLLDLTTYGRGEAWEELPEGRAVLGSGSPMPDTQACWTWRTDADGTATWGATSRPTAQWSRPGATPVTTLGRHGDGH